MKSNVEMITSLNPSVPVIADADTGYGGPIMVSRTVTQYARAGVAGMHIEDQAQEKRCGHLQGKVIVDRDVYYSRLRAAVYARNQLQSDMLIIARTDARQTYGFDESITRLKEAVKIGVDVVFFEAMATREEARKVCEIFGNTPVMLNMVPGGVTPTMTAAEAQELGFRIMIVPGVCIGPIVKSVGEELRYLKEHGGVSKGNTTAGVKEVFNLAGLQECIALDQHAGGKAFDTVGE